MPARVRPFSLLPVLLAAAVAGFTPARAALSGTAALTVLHDDNTSNSIRAQKADTAIGGEVSLGTLRVINRDRQGSLQATAGATAWQQWDGLDLQTVELTARLRRKFGLGAYAHRLDLSATPGYRFAATDERAAAVLHLEAAWTKRLSPAFTVHAAAAADRADARRGVYSTTGHSFGAGAAWDITERWRLAATARTRRGDLVSWCRASWPEFTGSNPWLDGIFGGDWFPYQTVSRTHAVHVGLSCALGRDTSFTLSADFSRSSAVAARHVYHNEILGLHVQHAF